MEVLLINLGLMFVLFVFLIYGAFSWGFVAFKFYGWFILSQPTFTTLPHFTITQFVGFLLFIGVLTHKSIISIKDEYKDKNFEYFSLLLGPWFVLLVGWMIQGLFF